MTNHAHILLRSGPYGLSKCMQRFLIGYAITYNRRHRRYGHLFQNRYKSVICQEDTYLLELASAAGFGHGDCSAIYKVIQ